MINRMIWITTTFQITKSLNCWGYWLKAYLMQFLSLITSFRNLDNNNFNGTLYIGNISGLSRKLPNGTIDGHLQSLNLTKTNISYVDYNSSDITDVTTTIM
jgi:hypothetical protein